MMTLIIVAILIIGYILISTGSMTNVNKAAVAIFMSAVGWVLYICYGTDFVMSQHPHEYTDFLAGAVPTSTAVKEYIAQNIFLKYVGKAAEIVLFLLATMTIVEILDNNGCFDFLSVWMRTRNSGKLLWMMSVITFVISANLDNLTTTMMMLMIMHKLLHSRRQRILYGCAIVLSANCGGALTVIGDTSGLVLWNTGAVTASNYSVALALPCLIAWAVPIILLNRMLPERLDVEWTAMPYRGDDTNLNIWQRLLMLVLGIGGLWFIPTFHNITKLSPFLGALCVLSILWVVNEIVNRKLMNSDQMIQRRMPKVLQYGVIQMILFVLGIMLTIGVVEETGAISWLSEWCDFNIHNIWIMGAISGCISTVLDNFATAMSFFSFYPVLDANTLSHWADSDYMMSFIQNGAYWKIIAYCTAVCSNILLVGSVSGLAFIKMERVHVGWYLRNFGWKVLLGWLLGLAVLYLQIIL